MFSRDELLLLRTLEQEYVVLIANYHDVRLRSYLTGHEWIVISPYDGSLCEILHRHSVRYTFHHQRGRYPSLVSALDYIYKHDLWYSKKERTCASLFNQSPTR